MAAKRGISEFRYRAQITGESTGTVMGFLPGYGQSSIAGNLEAHVWST